MALDQALLNQVLTSIKSSGLQWTAGPTSMLKLTAQDRKIRLGYVPAGNEPSLQQREVVAAKTLTIASTSSAALPASSDWRNRGGRNFVSSVKDQGGCGSCVAFGTTATLDAAVRVNKNIAVGEPASSTLLDLAEAQLFYCGAESQGATCLSGWNVTASLAYCTGTGLAPETDFPYTAGDQSCGLAAGWQQHVTQLSENQTFTTTADMKQWLASNGPLITCFTVYNDFYAYSSGVYKKSATATLEGGHCVCVVGYDEGQQAWICKNSWGQGWGQSGFFLIGYGECGIDATMWAATKFQSIYQLPYGFQPLGGVLTSNLAVTENADGRLEVFARGTDNALWHIWQVTPNGGWSGWASLGGAITSDPAAGRNKDGRLEVFARGTDNALYHIWQNTAGGGWSGWASLGGAITTNPAVAANQDGRLEAFARGTDNALYHIWQTAPGAGWSGWASLAGGLTSDPAVGRNSDGRLEVFVRGTDNALYHIWQTAAGAGWSAWAGLGGGLTSDPAVGTNADGRLEVFVRGTDNALYHIWQTAPGAGWSGWTGLGGVLTSNLSVASNKDGRLEVFGRGTDNALYHQWQVKPNAGWSGWASLGGAITSDPAVGVNADGRLEAFVRGTDNGLYHRWQVTPNGGWS